MLKSDYPEQFNAEPGKNEIREKMPAKSIVISVLLYDEAPFLSDTVSIYQRVEIKKI